MRNFEFKAPLADPAEATRRARALGAELWGDLRQTDTYFVVSNGRLKLRQTAGFPAELVFYARDEEGDDRESDYVTTPAPDAAGAVEALSRALGVRAVVRKRRTLILLDTTRIHLDNVEGLGWFLEFEVPVKEDEGAARALLDHLILGLGYTWDDCIRRSYVDMIEEGTA